MAKRAAVSATADNDSQSTGTVQFKLNQHSHSPLANGVMGQTITVNASDLPAILKMKLGEVVATDPEDLPEDD